MIARKIGCFASPVNFDPLKLGFLQFLFFLFFTHNCKILISYIIDIGQTFDIYPAPEAVGDKNLTEFFKANFNPLKLVVVVVNFLFPSSYP
jgi:hypothetical protein